MVLNANPTNFFAETEQVAFHRATCAGHRRAPTTRCCRAATSPTSTRR
jgi:catalase